MSEKRVESGKFYDFDKGAAEIGPIDQPDRVVCRRVDDFPGETAPDGAHVEKCIECGEAIAFSPDTPSPMRAMAKHCMQCCGIEPLPITSFDGGVAR